MTRMRKRTSNLSSYTDLTLHVESGVEANLAC